MAAMLPGAGTQKEKALVSGLLKAHHKVFSSLGSFHFSSYRSSQIYRCTFLVWHAVGFSTPKEAERLRARGSDESVVRSFNPKQRELPPAEGSLLSFVLGFRVCAQLED